MVRASLILILAITAIVAAKKEGNSKSADGEAPKPPSCENEASQILKLEAALEASKKTAEKDIAKVTDELNVLKKSQCESFSVVDPIVNTYRFAIDAGTTLFERSTVDEKIVASVTTAYNMGKTATTAFIDKASSVNYAAHMEDLKNHELYRTHVAPHVEKAHSQLKPHLDQHVLPTIEKVKVQMGPHFETAKVHAAAVTKRVHEEVMPALQKHATKAKDAIYNLPIEKVTSPIFEAFAKAAPNQAHALPTKTPDRAIILFFALYVLMTGFAWGKRILRIVIFFARMLFKLVWVAFQFCVLLPLKIFFKVLRIAFCISTCCNCCCLCRTKHKVGDLKSKADNSKDKKADVGEQATVADLQKLFENVKKEKKNMDDAAKQLAKFVKNGKQMEKPEFMKGKTISKDVLTKACGKFGEINIKKLSL